MSESSLRHSLTPFYSELFSLIARVEGGIKFLVDLRGDLLVSHTMSDHLFVTVVTLSEVTYKVFSTTVSVVCGADSVAYVDYKAKSTTLNY